MILVVHGVAMSEKGLGKLNNRIVFEILSLRARRKYEKIILTQDQNNSPKGESFGSMVKKVLLKHIPHLDEDFIFIPKERTYETVGEIQMFQKLTDGKEFEVLTLWSHRKRVSILYKKLGMKNITFHRTKIFWPGIRRLIDDFVTGLIIAILLPPENFLVKKIRTIRAAAQNS